MEQPERVRRAVMLAIDAGNTAADATRQIALRNSDPADRGTVLRRFLSGGVYAVRGPPPTVDQIRSACDALDEFTSSLTALNAYLASADAHVDALAGASARLWASKKASAEIHNEVNATLALLGRYRTNMILKRPLLFDR